MTGTGSLAVLATGERASGPSVAGRAYLTAVVAAALAAAGPFYARAADVHRHWGTFAVLALAAMFAHTFPVKSPRSLKYHTSVVFLMAGALLLPPELLVLIPIVQTLPAWLRDRHPWHVQSVNVAIYTLGALAAWGIADLVRSHGRGLVDTENATFALGGLGACLAFVATNHLLVAGQLRFGRRRSWGETGLFTTESLSIDLVLALLGVTVAAFWLWDPWLIPAALAPLVVVDRSLSVPQLQAEARVDPKTGLYNARYFASALATEIGRARRLSRPMSLIMADLDLLREVNNSFGHLAGDAVLEGIAEIFRSQLRQYDVPARFGGEEFSILLPETTSEQAFEIAERIRRAVAAAAFDVETAGEPIHVTVSIGVATLGRDGDDANELIHQADLAVYRAKLQGRNRVTGASKEPLLLGAGRTARLHAVREDGKHVIPLAPARQVRPVETIQSQNSSLEEANRLLRERSIAAMQSLSATVDARDSYTAGHSRRVQQIALALGRQLGLSNAELDLLGHAALFHDIGKVAVPDAILLKPGPLTPAEWERMQTHADEGARIIDRLGFLQDAVPAIRHHHERFDGTGYPHRLAGEEIPLGARIIHVADALDSLRATRRCRAARDLPEALAELRQAAGTQFCPRCVDALAQILPLDGDVPPEPGPRVEIRLVAAS
ncbi:MAG: diguanylate cyclase [Gaiellaceae bacterium]